MPKVIRTITGVLKSTSLDYFVETEDADIFLVNMSYRDRHLLGSEVMVKGVVTGLYKLRVEQITPAE
jgi:hypothetical protein